MVGREVDRPLWAVMGRSRCLCALSWATFGAYVDGLGPVSGPLWGVLGRSRGLWAVLGCFRASAGGIRAPPATAEPLARPRPQKKTNHRNHQPHHSTHQPRPAALGWEPSHPDRLIRSPTDQKDRLSTRTHLFRPPRRAAGCACRAARLGCGSGSCTRNRAGCGPVVGSWLGFAP